MVKCVGAILIAVAAILIGRRFAYRLRQRICIMLDIANALETLSMEACYGLAVLPQAFYAAARKQEGIVGQWLTVLYDQLIDNRGGTFEQAWKDSLIVLADTLSDKDIAELEGIGQQLTNCNGSYLEKIIEFYLERIREYVRVLEEGYDQQAKLYQSLSLCAGLFLIIVMI